jgi:hypothetical protein
MSIGCERQIPPRRTQIAAPDGFMSNTYALELTVPHKTVAETV